MSEQDPAWKNLLQVYLLKDLTNVVQTYVGTIMEHLNLGLPVSILWNGKEMQLWDWDCNRNATGYGRANLILKGVTDQDFIEATCKILDEAPMYGISETTGEIFASKEDIIGVWLLGDYTKANNIFVFLGCNTKTNTYKSEYDCR